MKIILKDGTSTITNVAKVDEHITMLEGKPVPSLSIQIDMSSGITGDKLVELNDTVGLDCITVVDELGQTLAEYRNFPTLSAIHTIVTDRTRYVNLTFTPDF